MERDTIWVWIAEKERPGVILEVQPDLVRVAYGTSEWHEWPRVVVHAESRQGRAFHFARQPFLRCQYLLGAAAGSPPRPGAVHVGAAAPDS